MNKIEVAVINTPEDPGATMMFLAKLTQRGHQIKNMDDLLDLQASGHLAMPDTIRRVAAMPHGTIKRFTPITIAIVGASRRFLAQARTHQVGMNYVSASLQYSDYTGTDDFVVPYDLLGSDVFRDMYLQSCKESMEVYARIARRFGNDTAGYAAPQGLRNILIMQGNQQSWEHFIKLRACNRNTVETQYVTMLIWKALLATQDGKEMFAWAGPECMFGKCREGKMACGTPLRGAESIDEIINSKWPRLKGL